MSNYMSNPVLALMNNDSEDAFVRDVAEAYFSNPAHVRRILTEDCIESCLDAYMGNQTVELDLSDLPENQDGFTKPSRKNRRKKSNRNNKKSKADRFHGCRKAYWKHQYKKWGTNERRQALEKDGFGALHASHRIHTKGAMPMPYVPEGESETRTFTYEDGFTLSMSMSKNAWETEPEDDFSPSFNWDRMEQREKCVPDWCYDEYRIDWDSYEPDDFFDEDDELVVTEDEDSYEFSAIEMADMSMKMATATAEQRAKIRKFFRSL